MMKRWNGLIEEYKEWLPVTENTPTVNVAGREYTSHSYDEFIRTMGNQSLRENGRDESDRFI